MQLQRTFHIECVRVDHPGHFAYDLRSLDEYDIELSELHLPVYASEVHHLPLSVDLIGRNLLCVLTSCDASVRSSVVEKYAAERDEIEPTDGFMHNYVVVRDLRRIESWGNWHFGGGGHTEIQMHLMSFHEDEDSMNFPSYDLHLVLNQEELEECLGLSRDSLFETKWQLMAEEKSGQGST